MRHVLIFHDDPVVARLLTGICEGEGYRVTLTDTVEDTLMVLRTTLHPLIVVAERDHSCLRSDGPFFQTIRDHRDLYGQHRYVALYSWQLSEEDAALLDGLGVCRLGFPFSWEDFLRVLEEAAVQI